ncbi:MAG: RNA polymerase sporulation sigma factor SigK [Lachnospiraceae bacterium]|nr:RNA polymerase sporulation sigma factor SigK [Lachnospiraceae bacterium]
MQSFLKPLSKEEEHEYLQQLKGGDLEARNKLVEHNLRLVAHIVKKYNNLERDMDDLISIGTIGLIKAVNTYDESKGNRLVTYASRCIENELLMLLRREKKCSKEVSLYEPIGTDKEGNEISLLDIIHCEDENILNLLVYSSNVKRLYEEVAALPDLREKQVLIFRYGLYGGEEMPQREVARLLGISRSYVSRIEKRALEHLRKRFNHVK